LKEVSKDNEIDRMDPVICKGEPAKGGRQPEASVTISMARPAVICHSQASLLEKQKINGPLAGARTVYRYYGDLCRGYPEGVKAVKIHQVAR